jgi:hypothetical protein
MLLFIKLIHAVLLPFMSGFAILTFLDKDKTLTRPLALGLAYGIGTGLITLWMFLLGAGHIPFGVLTLSAPFYLLCFLLFFTPTFRHYLTSIKNPLPPDEAALPLATWQKILYPVLVTYIFYYIVFVFWRALNIPVFVWDGIATISFKAKVFFFHQGLIPLNSLPHPSYPLHIPLLQTWVATNLGFWDDQLVKIFFPFTFVAYLSIHYSFLKKLTNSFWAMFGTALVVSSNFFVFFASVSYRDFFLLYYNCTTIMLLIPYNRQESNRLLSLAGFFSGMTTFTKLEGVGYFLIHVGIILLMIIKKNAPVKIKAAQFLRFFLTGFTILALYAIYRIVTNVPSSGRFIILAPWEHLDRIPQILKTFSANLFLSGNWNILWFVLIWSLSRWLERPIRTPEGWLGLTLLAFFSMYFLLGWLTPNFISLAGSEAIDVLPRVILHFFPLAPLLLTLLIADGAPKG